jgi:hypothetical protein
MMSDSPTPDISFEERRLNQEMAFREREVAIKEREVAAKEREVLAKQEELKRSRWLNPTVIGIFAAALGLMGSVIVARVNNANTQEVERLQSEASITLEAIKTGTGNTDAACKNLVFFVSLGLVHDPEGKIADQCKNAPTGPPSLPANQPNTQPQTTEITGRVIDIESMSPIKGALVSASNAHADGLTDLTGTFRLMLPHPVSPDSLIDISVNKHGYEPAYLTTALSEQPFEIRMRRVR